MKKKTRIQLQREQLEQDKSSSGPTNVHDINQTTPHSKSQLQAQYLNNNQISLVQRQALAQQLSQQHGNQYVQRLIQRSADNDAENEDTQTAQFDVTQSPQYQKYLATASDINSALDLGLNIADLANAAVMETASMAKFSGLVGMAGIGFMIYSFVSELSSAMDAGKRIGGITGASYTLLCIAHGQEIPAPPEYFDAKGRAGWHQATTSLKTQIANQFNMGGDKATDLLYYFFHMSRKDPFNELNRIYQVFVEKELKQYGFQFGGLTELIFGVPGAESNSPSYYIAKDRVLTWPKP